jgi:hypothetical protein
LVALEGAALAIRRTRRARAGRRRTKRVGAKRNEVGTSIDERGRGRCGGVLVMLRVI